MPTWIRCLKWIDNNVGHNARLVCALKWGILFLFLVWNVQVVRVYHGIEHMGRSTKFVYNANTEKWAMLFFRQKLDYAKAHRKQYSAERYCHDLVAIRWKAAKAAGSSKAALAEHPCINELQVIMQENYKSRKLSATLVKVMRRHDPMFEKTDHDIDHLLGRVNIDGEDFRDWLPQAFLWLVWFYLASRVTTLLFLLVRMAESHGILEEFCQDKKGFFKALFLWAGVFDYPSFIFDTRLIAQAKYRVVKGVPFRKLTEAEEAEIAKISVSWEAYEAWKEALPEDAALHKVQYVVRFSSALAAMLIFAALAAAQNAYAESKKVGATCSISVAVGAGEARAGPTIVDDQDDGGTTAASAEIMPEVSDLPVPDLITFWRVVDIIRHERHRSRKVEHVPWLGWLIVQVHRSIQSAGAKTSGVNGGRKCGTHMYRFLLQ